MNMENEFFERLAKEGITVTPEQREQIRNQLSKIINYEPEAAVM